MDQWPIFAELEICLLACTVLYLNLLALCAYAGLARRHGDDGAHGEEGGEATQRVRLPGGPLAAAVMFAFGLVAALALMARLIWLQA